MVTGDHDFGKFVFFNIFHFRQSYHTGQGESHVILVIRQLNDFKDLKKCRGFASDDARPPLTYNYRHPMIQT